MKSSSAQKIHLTGLDSLFGTTDTSQDSEQESILYVPITELHAFHNHPFRVVNDDAMGSMVESIKEYGVHTPALARPLDGGG